jgi:NADH-quinone oxidoreductase subunit G
MAGKLTVGVIGQGGDLTYDYEHLGDDAAAVSGLAKSKSEFAKAFKLAQRPLLLIGQGALLDAGSLAALSGLVKAFNLVRDGWNGWAVLHTAASRVGGLDMGFVPAAGGKTAADLVKKGGASVLVLLGADELDLSKSDAFKIYVGTHGDAGAHAADLILPGAAYTEKDGLYVNTEGRVQMGQRAVFPKGDAKEDWAILRALSERLGSALPYDSLDQIRAKLFADHPTFGQIDYAPGSKPSSVDLTKLGDAKVASKGGYANMVTSFHLTNPIARASVTMAECSALASGTKMAAE